MELVVPPFERRPWPTLGPEVCALIEERLVFGPGDLRGQRAVLDAEQRALVYRMYEVHPKGDPREGKRRFQRISISLRKGLRKTELAAWIAAVELHPEGPVRCDGFRKIGGVWVPVGKPVNDPYIPMLAYTEDQSEELGYGALYAILADCDDADLFDIGLQRIMRLDSPGRAVALANAPDQADGARTTFQHKDESHRWVLPRHRETDRVTRMNLMKRPLADPWELDTTTMYAPGEGSVAESNHDYAIKVAAGMVKAPRLFYFHRQASDTHDLTTDKGLRDAVVEASGIAAEWSDIDGIVQQWGEPDADKALLMRMWLNMPIKPGAAAFDAVAWDECVKKNYEPAKGALVVVGFDGSRYWDSTAIVVTEIMTGYQWIYKAWHRDDDQKEWEVPKDEVDKAVDELFEHFDVWRFYGDPSKWEQSLATWAGMYGEKRVIRWEVSRNLEMAKACRAFGNAILAGDLQHPPDPIFRNHVGNAYKRYITQRDDDGGALWVIQKERPDSPKKIDAAAAAVYSWRARLDAIASGITDVKEPLIVWD